MFLKIISVLLLLGATTGAGLAVSAIQNEKPPIPPDLFFAFKEVPPQENGIIDWRRAGEATVIPTEKVRKAFKYIWTPDMRKPAEDIQGDLQNWLNQNQGALRLLAASLQKPKMQWPVHPLGSAVPEYKTLGYLLPARLLEADQLAEAGRFQAAVDSLAGSLRIAAGGIEGDASLTEYMLAGQAREKVQDVILRQAGRNQMPMACLQQLLAGLPELKGETNAYANALRVDFTIYDYESFDLKQISESWSKIAETNLAMMIYPEELRRPFKIILDPALISQHPLPLDMVSTIENDLRHYRIFLTNALNSWTNRSTQVEEERETAKTKLLEDIEPLMELVKDEPLPLSRRAAQRARGAYLKIENPLGRILGLSILAENGSRVFRYRTDREATRTVLALLIFERQKGRLPATLSDLVEAGLLKSVPVDPFSDAPLHYSRERRLVWSVGVNGTDDQGDGSELHWVGDDAVWNIPKI